MKEMVFKAETVWTYAKDLIEIFRYRDVEVQDFDDSVVVPLTDSFCAEVCVIRQGNKYGVYSADSPNTYCTPTSDPFPYDEVKESTYFDGPYKDYGYFAFRIDNKWGILQIADAMANCDKDVYDVKYAATLRRIVVPCQYESLEEAAQQLSDQVDFKDPFASKL